MAKGLTTVTASFSQTLTDANGGAGKTTRGFLAEGAAAIPLGCDRAVSTADRRRRSAREMVHDPDPGQVTVRNQGVEEAHSPLTVLTDLSQLDHDFRASEQVSATVCSGLRLTPKAKDAGIRIRGSGLGRELWRAWSSRTPLGNCTQIVFSDWKRNVPPLDDARFTSYRPRAWT